jgi:hypothetical protein
VRAGNDAWRQYQGDIFGEVMMALQSARELAWPKTNSPGPLQRAPMTYVE